MSKVKSTKFRFIAFLLCALLVISGFVPVMGGLRAKALTQVNVRIQILTVFIKAWKTYGIM